MSAQFPWWWAALAVALALLASLASSNYGVAVPAAVAAVAFATLAVVETALRLANPRRGRSTGFEPASGSLGSWLGSGPIGREEVVRTLDFIERQTLRPNLPSCPPEEVARLLRLSSSDFRRYVLRRLDYLEGAS